MVYSLSGTLSVTVLPCSEDSPEARNSCTSFNLTLTRRPALSLPVLTQCLTAAGLTDRMSATSLGLSSLSVIVVTSE